MLFYGMDDFTAGLNLLFNTLQRDAPLLAANAIPLSRGGNGLVIDHQDNTLSKVFMRAEDIASQSRFQQIYDDEVRTLRLLHGSPLANVDIPEVLSETPLPDSKTMFASYRMTRLPGQVMYGWDYFTKNYDPAQTAPHFRDVGALLANFHAIAAERLADVTPQSRPWFEWGSDIAQVPALGADINTELAAADRYLRANKQDGVAHGDFHTSNYMVDENFRITGLLDFSFSGRTDNDLIDFAAIPDAQRDVVLTEYERLSGRDIDRTLATVTALSLDARILHWATQNPDGAAAREDVLGRMQRRLDIVRPATMI